MEDCVKQIHILFVHYFKIVFQHLLNGWVGNVCFCIVGHLQILMQRLDLEKAILAILCPRFCPHKIANLV